jgi:hypothetical protein
VVRASAQEIFHSNSGLLSFKKPETVLWTIVKYYYYYYYLATVVPKYYRLIRKKPGQTAVLYHYCGLSRFFFESDVIRVLHR